MSWKWVVDVHGGDARVDWKWVAVSLVAGLGLLFLLQVWIAGWALAAVVSALAVVAITVDVMLRREGPGRPTPRGR